MAGRFEFESPGAAFTSEIAKTLMQRKADERQQLIDSLAFSADQRAAEEARRQEARDAQLTLESNARMESQKQQDELARMGVLAGNMRMGDNPEEQGVSPENVAALRKWGFIHDVPTVTNEDPNSGETSVGATNGVHPAFVGTVQEREKDARRKQSGDVVAKLMASNDPQKQQVAQILEAGRQNNDGIIPESMFQYLAPNKRYYSMSPTGTLKDTGQELPPWAEVEKLGYPPSAYFAPEPAKQWIGNDPDDPSGNTQLYMDRSGNISKVRGYRPSGQGAIGQANMLGIPEEAYKRLEEVTYNLGIDPRSVDEAALAEYRSRAGSAIGNSKLPHSVKLVALRYLNNPEQALQMANEMLEQGKMSRQDVDALSAAISALVPEHVKDILKQNPYAPKQDEPGLLSKIWNYQWRNNGSKQQ